MRNGGIGLRAVAMAMLIGGLTGPAGAVDLVNRDIIAHQVLLLQAGQPHRFMIAGHSTFRRVCAACVVEIDSQGRIDAEDNDTVTILDGQPKIGG